jgi:hypothetical protein
MIGKLTTEERTLVLRSHDCLKQAQLCIGIVERALQESFAKAKERRTFDASFVPSGDGKNATFHTNFGSGRSISVNAIIDGKPVIRYIFEKEATDSFGKKFHVPLGEIRFDSSGLITSEDGTKLADLDSVDEDFVSVGEIGLAVIYLCATEKNYAV